MPCESICRESATAAALETLPRAAMIPAASTNTEGCPPARRHRHPAGGRSAPGDRPPPPPDPDRRIRIHLPCLPCPAADDATGRHPGERRFRLHQHARQAAARACRDAHRRDLRCRSRHVPQPSLRQLQGQPSPTARGADPAIRPDPRGDRGLLRSRDRTGRLGSRRPDRRLCRGGGASRRAGDDRVVRQGPDAAHPPRGGDAGPDQAEADRPARSDGKIRRHPR